MMFPAANLCGFETIGLASVFLLAALEGGGTFYRKNRARMQRVIQFDGIRGHLCLVQLIANQQLVLIDDIGVAQPDKETCPGEGLRDSSPCSVCPIGVILVRSFQYVDVVLHVAFVEDIASLDVQEWANVEEQALDRVRVLIP